MIQKRIISLDIDCISYKECMDKIYFFANNNVSSFVCVANVHMLIEAYKSKIYAELVNNGSIVISDGMPLAKSIYWLYGIKQERIAGMDLLPDLLSMSEKMGLKVFFFGGTHSMLEKTKVFCSIKFPELDVVGYISPPFRPLSTDEEKDYIQKINDSKAGFVFVALGCPKQEKWMASMKGRINACMIGIGGALPVMIGMQKRAPKWMQDSGLEWVYRLSQEPGRLFGRYFKTNSIFIFLFIKEFIKLRLLKKM